MDLSVPYLARIHDKVPVTIQVAVGAYFGWTLARFCYYQGFLAKANKVEGKQFLITGACGCLGSALCKELARKKAHTLILWDVRNEDLIALSKELQTMHPQVRVIARKTNLLYEDEIEQACNEIIQNDQVQLDVLVNNAGIANVGPIQSFSADQERSVIQINYLAQVQLVKTFIPYFENKKRGRGHIACTGSLVAFSGGAGLASYCASKFALRGFLEGTATELLLSGSPVTISMFCPGLFDSKLFAGYTVPFVSCMTGTTVAQAFVYNALERRFSMTLFPAYFGILAMASSIVNVVLGKMLLVPIDGTSNWTGAKHVKQSLGL